MGGNWQVTKLGRKLRKANKQTRIDWVLCSLTVLPVMKNDDLFVMVIYFFVCLWLCF